MFNRQKSEGISQVCPRLLVSIVHLLVGEEELEVLELAACVGDFIGVSVKTLAVLVLAPGFVVSEHAQAVLHGEDLIIHSTVVPVLIAQIIKALAQLSNQLVLLRGSDLDSRGLSATEKPVSYQKYNARSHDLLST